MEIKSKLQQKQLEASRYWLDDETEEILYGGAKYGAKTYLGCSLIFGDALTYPGTHYFIGRHNLIDLKKFTTPSIHEVFNNWGLEAGKYIKFNGQENYFEIYNGSRVYYMDCKYLPSDPDFHRFGSLQFTRGWIEEIGQVHSLAIVNLSASVGRWNNSKYNLKRKVLMTCNPNKGYAYNEFYLPDKNNTLPKYRKFVKALPTDNKYLTKDYLAALDRLPENERQRLRFGNWDYDSDPTTLIDFEFIANLYTNIYVKGGTNYIIADVARYGSDKAVITVWDGLILIDRVVFKISSTVEIQNAINALRVKYKVLLTNVLVDEDGIGGGVVDNLRCKGFLNGGKPRNKNYQNQKTECGYKLAEQINNIYINAPLTEMERETINQELGMLKTYDSDKDGKLRILPKEKIKEQIGRSPDWLDCFIMRMYYEVNISKYIIE